MTMHWWDATALFVVPHERTLSINVTHQFNLSANPRAACMDSLYNISSSTISTSRASCGGIVDYRFYVPESETVEGLNEKARRLLSNQIFDLLPRSCRASAKILVCTNVYRECKTPSFSVTGDWAEVAPILANQPSDTVSRWGDSSLLPFKLPCSTICDEVTDTCKGVLEYVDTGDPDLNQYFNCSAKLTARKTLSATENITVITDLYPASTGGSSRDASCINMSAVAVDVAESIEVYAGIGNAVCRGVVSNVYIPSSGPSAFPGSRSLNLLPMTGTFEAQAILESRVDELLKRLPVWISGACYASVRTLLCKSYMMSGQNQSFQEVFDKTVFSSSSLIISALGRLQNYRFYVPAYPSRSLCETVRTHCNGLYSFLWEDTDVHGESYIPPCNVTSSEGLQLYPETEQTVREVRLRKLSSSPSSSPSSIQVNISSDPSLLTASQRVEQDKAASSWATVCPHGFVNPEEPQHRRTNWVEGTGCAVACR